MMPTTIDDPKNFDDPLSLIDRAIVSLHSAGEHEQAGAVRALDKENARLRKACEATVSALCGLLAAYGCSMLPRMEDDINAMINALEQAQQ